MDIFHIGGLTSAKTVPYLIALSTILSVGSSIIGEYVSSNPSSSLRDERRSSAYAEIVSRDGWAMAKRQTVSFDENRNSSVY